MTDIQTDLFASQPRPPIRPASQPADTPPRRLDITLERLRKIVESLPEADNIKLGQDPRWPLIDTVMAVRAMERAEEEALGRVCATFGPSIADHYDRMISPGEPILEALARLFADFYGPRPTLGAGEGP